jgi:uncharacterized protein YukE
MTTPGPGSITGHLDGIASNASGLQDVSDTQNGIMQHLGSTFDGLAPNFHGQAGTAMQQLGQQLHAAGAQLASTFADHSHMMHNNATLLGSSDEQHAHVINQVANLTH